MKTTLLKESRRISERLEFGVVECDTHNMPLRPLSNESINKCMAELSRILDDAVERGYLRDNLRELPQGPQQPPTQALLADQAATSPPTEEGNRNSRRSARRFHQRSPRTW